MTRVTHGETKTSLYKRWDGMKQRCFNKNSDAYKHYGKRGIKMCKEWEVSYVSFRDWAISHGYEEHLTIERIDVNGDYCPNNCKWIPKADQLRNKRNSLKYNGDCARTKSLKLGGSPSLIFMRIKSGWTKEDAFNKPIDRSTSYKGESATAASKRLGGSRSMVCVRLKIGWSKKRAFTTYSNK